jgi:hypothetical protein
MELRISEELLHFIEEDQRLHSFQIASQLKYPLGLRIPVAAFEVFLPEPRLGVGWIRLAKQTSPEESQEASHG